MLIIAITTHNIPEGMSVGLAFALAGQNMQDTALLSGAVALAIGIGIQNFPEGTAVALPLVKEGVSKKRAFVIASMTAVVEPLFGCACSSICEICKCIDCNITCICCGNNDLCRCGRTDSTGAYGRKREDGHTRICCRFPCDDDIGCCAWIRKVLFTSECGKMEKGWGTKVMFTHHFWLYGIWFRDLKVYPISSHFVSNSSKICPFVEEVLCSRTTAPGCILPSSLSNASSFVGCLS